MPVSPGLTEAQADALASMGISRWERRGLAGADKNTADTPCEVGLAKLEAQVAACTLCDLHSRRTQTVFGTGHINADWMFIGEAPGAEEDRQGQPFVGRAGRLLDQMILAVGLKREQVYIANILKCRPPENRDPRPEEVASCSSYLEAQVRLISPRIIVAVGRIAAQNLLGSSEPVGRMRGRLHHYGSGGIPVIVTYHPAYLLRSPAQKSKVWQDLCLAMETIGGPGS